MKNLIWILLLVFSFNSLSNSEKNENQEIAEVKKEGRSLSEEEVSIIESAHKSFLIEEIATSNRLKTLRLLSNRAIQSGNEAKYASLIGEIASLTRQRDFSRNFHKEYLEGLLGLKLPEIQRETFIVNSEAE